MSLVNNRTVELWRSFIPRRGQITNVAGTDMFSVNIYSNNYFADFNPSAEFEKWAAVPVSDIETFPDGMDTFIIPEGKYAIFHYKAAPGNAAEVFQYIFSSGCHHQRINWIIALILKCLAKSIVMEVLTARRIYGYR